MKKILYLAVLTIAAFSWSGVSAANHDASAGWIKKQNKQVEVKAKKEQQRMEEPSSTAVGGSRSGDLSIEKEQDAQLNHDEEKQKFLYEYEDKYRRGL